MQKLLIALAWLTGLAAAGVLDGSILLDRKRLMDDSNGDRLVRMSRGDLLRQKFLLDVLQHVNKEVVSDELLDLGKTLVVDSKKYVQGIDDEMLQIIESCRGQRLLGKNDIFTIANEEHVRQMIGLYRLLVRSRDWDTFQRNAVFSRIHMNGVLFVNALLLAVRDRDDTQLMVMPPIYEILPELYFEEELQERVSNIDLALLTTDKHTYKPNLLDMIGLNRLNKYSNRDPASSISLDRSQLWMPWRELRMEMAIQKDKDVKTRMLVQNENKIIFPVARRLTTGDRRMAMLTQDVSFQGYLQGLINDLLLRENELLCSERMVRQEDRIGRVGIKKNIGVPLERGLQERIDEDIRSRRINTGTDAESGIGRNRVLDTERNVQLESQERIDIRGPLDPQDRLLYVGRRRKQLMASGSIEQGRYGALDTQRNRFLDLVETNRINDGRRVVGVDSNEEVLQERQGQRLDRNDDLISRRRLNRINSGNDRQTQYDRGNVLTRNRDIIDRTDIINDDRQGRMRNEIDDDYVSGRRVDRIDQRVRQSKPITRDRGSDIGLNSDEIRIVSDMRNRDLNIESKNRRVNLDQSVNDNDRLLYMSRRRLVDQQNVRDGRRVVDRDEDEDVDFRNRGKTGRRDGDLDISCRRCNRNMDNDDELWRMRKVYGQVDDDFQRVQMRHLQDIGTEPDQQRLRDLDTDGIRRRVMDGKRWGGIDRTRRIIADSDIRGGQDDIRSRRSRSIGLEISNEDRRITELLRGSEVVLHNLQQLMARINIERISLGVGDIQRDLDAQRINSQRLTEDIGARYALRLNEMRLDVRRNRLLLEKMNDIERRLDVAMEQELRGSSSLRNGLAMEETDIDRILGDVLLGKVEGIGLLTALREIMQLIGGASVKQRLNDVSVAIDEPIVQQMLCRIVRLVDARRNRELGGYKRRDLQLSDVTINDVKIDKLRTFVDVSDTDLINLLDERVQLRKVSLQKLVVSRQTRLNHKPFTLDIDLNSERNQRVLIRTMLGPKISTDMDWNEQRRSFMQLDVLVADLSVGRNIIRRKSKEIMWTTRDATPFTEIYQRVMLALDGEQDLSLGPIVGQTCRFPHHLILPQGRVEGLPLQLLAIVTPIRDEGRLLQRTLRDESLCGVGVDLLQLDNLPLGFPVDRKVDDFQQLLTLPNILLKDVIIYHDDKLKMDIL